MGKLYTQEEWKKYEEMYKVLETFATSYMIEFCHRDATLQGIDIYGGEVVINTETYFSGCGSDYDSYNIPLAWLSEPDLMDRCRQQSEEATRKEQERKDEQERKRKEKQKEQDYKKFLELKDKFEK